MIFTHQETIYCPICAAGGNRYGKAKLICATRSYSGYPVDLGHCEECGRAFFVSYQVKELRPIPELDGPDRIESLQILIKQAEANKQNEAAEITHHTTNIINQDKLIADLQHQLEEVIQSRIDHESW